MARTRLALIPAAWLALAGAATPQQADTIRQLAECRLDPAQALPAIATLPVADKREMDDGPRKRIIRDYDRPAGVTVFGTPVSAVSSLETIETGRNRIMIITTVKAPMATVESAALSANGKSACENQDEGGRTTCNVAVRFTPSGRVTLMIASNEGATDIACSYQRSQ